MHPLFAVSKRNRKSSRSMDGNLNEGNKI